MADDITLSFVIVGHIDHGKSTLIGRLLYETDSLPSDKIEEVKKASNEKGRATEFAYLLDHLEEERKQGITIDTTQVFFNTPKRHYVIIDAPGHVEFVKNMITGASQAEAAVLIIDAAESVKEQTKRHSYMLSLLGLKQVVVVLNKMDLVEYSAERFEQVRDEAQQWLDSIGIKPLFYIPICALSGDNITTKSDRMGFYDGPTFLESLDTLQNKMPAEDQQLLLPIQDVYKVDNKRINAGRVEAGVLKSQTQVDILPSGQSTTIVSIEKFPTQVETAAAGDCIGAITADAVFLERGNVLCLAGSEPKMTDTINANMFCLSKQQLSKDQKMIIRCSTQETPCRIAKIDRRINSSSLEIIETDADVVKNLEVAEVTIKTKKPIAIKDFNDVPELGRFVLVRDEDICAGGIVTSVD